MEQHLRLEATLVLEDHAVTSAIQIRVNSTVTHGDVWAWAAAMRAMWESMTFPQPGTVHGSCYHKGSVETWVLD